MGVTVRHNARLAGLLALVAGVLTVAWFSRALQTGSTADWAWCVLVAAVAVLQLLVVRDGRAPLMVADEQGIRVRRGETWSGLRWQDIARVEVRSPSAGLRDGAVVVHPRVVTEEEDLDAAHTGPVVEDAGSSPAPSDVIRTGTSGTYEVPLGHTTRVHSDGMTGDLVADLDTLASGQVPVLVPSRLVPETLDAAEDVSHDEDADGSAEGSRDGTAGQDGPGAERPSRLRAERARWAGRLGRGTVATSATIAPGEGGAPEQDPEQDHEKDRAQDPAHDSQQGQASPPAPDPETDAESDAETDAVTESAPETEPETEPVLPGRETRPAARSEVLRETVRRLPDAPAVPAQRGQGSPVVVARVHDAPHGEPQPVEDALIGPLVAAARHRARLSIDTLSERTRIRPHVLECIEVDDFAACGGDFYARGHLRTLARVFGLDAGQLLSLYDDHYAQAEIEARQVFEAELASGIGGGVRTAHSGPRWTLLAACVLALAGVWGVARVFNDTPQELVSPAPNVVDSAGLATAEPAQAPKTTLAPLEVTAVGASPQVVVRDRDGRILWAAKLDQGQRRQVIGLAPFEVTASNGGAVKVVFLGKPKGTVGDTRAAASRQFG